MRRLVGAEAHDALNLKRARSLLAGKQEVDDAEPGFIDLTLIGPNLRWSSARLRNVRAMREALMSARAMLHPPLCRLVLTGAM